MSSAADIASARRRRGASRGSVTRLTKKLKDLEGRAGNPATLAAAQQMKKSLENVDAAFKTHHFSLIELIEADADLEKEQEVLDAHDELVDDLLIRTDRLILSCTVNVDPELRSTTSKRITRLEKTISTVDAEIAKISDPPIDLCLVRQREEQLHGLKQDLNDIGKALVTLDLDDKDELMVRHTALDTKIFEDSLQLKRMIQDSIASTDSRGVKLPKLDVPVFNGNILHWSTFWEQFTVAVYSRKDISDSEKLVYLRQSLREGSAKNAIEGLSRTGDNYAEAVECLKARYDRPRLIHQTHVKKILEIPVLKTGNGRELRHLHDVVQQHLRALKSMGYEPSAPFITSVLELKLNVGTMFEWQKHSNSSTGVPHFNELLEFINLRAQASEHTTSGSKRAMGSGNHTTNSVTSFAANTQSPTTADSCVLCKTDVHPLFACSKFKSLPRDRMVATVKANNLCLNCLRPGHHLKHCKSLHKCRECQRPHHTLLHIDKGEPSMAQTPTGNSSTSSSPPTLPSVSSHTATGLKSNSLLMTCQLMVISSNGLSIKARALLDSGSSVSFVSNRLARSLHLDRSQQFTRISGIAGLTHSSSSHTTTNFHVSPLVCPTKRFDVSAIIVPQVTCSLPVCPLPPASEPVWHHLNGIQLADPNFGVPGAIDVLLGIDIFAATLLQGRRTGPPGYPTAIETEFGWVLAGSNDPLNTTLVSNHASLLSGNDFLRHFWEIEEVPSAGPVLSQEERAVADHYQATHSRSPEGRFIVPLPKRPNAPNIGESRSQAVKRFLSMERSLHAKRKFSEFSQVVEEYFTLKHAEEVPVTDLQKPPEQVFYMPMHAVRKETSSTTKVRVVFDASAKSNTGVSLNDILMVGPTVHPTLIDVLLRFRVHRVAITADISKMYRAVQLTPSDQDYHRFVWRSDCSRPLIDYRMTRITFGVSASSFAANMSVKQNAADYKIHYPLAAAAVDNSLYVDDCLTGADTTAEALALQSELQELFNKAHFTLRKWNSSDPTVLDHIPPELRESYFTHLLPDPTGYTKTLGVEWNSLEDVFRLTTADLPDLKLLTKRQLTSDIAKTFDILGWFSPSIIKAKILLQRLWERKIDWDETAPPDVLHTWRRWRLELPLLASKHIQRCYFTTGGPHECRTQLHGFSDASEAAYSSVVYLRVQNPDNSVHVSLIASKTRVAPLKRLTIPRLELCGAQLLSLLVSHVEGVLKLPGCEVYAWTDSMVVLGWLNGDPRKFKPFVANRITQTIESIPATRWRHVSGSENPADSASRGLFPSELLKHNLWWNGPEWLSQDPSRWPQSPSHPYPVVPEEERSICLAISIETKSTVIPLDHYSSFSKLLRVTAWILRFIKNCRPHVSTCPESDVSQAGAVHLTTSELIVAEKYWIRFSQEECFSSTIVVLQMNGLMRKGDSLISLHPFIDSDNLLRVGGREGHSNISKSKMHPIILHGKHAVTKLIIRQEHIRLLHAGPTLLSSSLSRRFSIVGLRRTVRSITCQCVICRKQTARPQPQMLGQLPLERITPGLVFEKVGVDYAGPLYVKSGMVRRITTVKAYICLFVSLSVKAVHLEIVSALTTEAFIATLRRFIVRRGYPSLIWSDHGTNFVGANRELKELHEFLKQQTSETDFPILFLK